MSVSHRIERHTHVTDPFHRQRTPHPTTHL